MAVQEEMPQKLKVLAVTNMCPTPKLPISGRFVERQQQLQALRLIGLDSEVLWVDRVKKGMKA
jgi:hypothetical protein